MTTTVSQSNRSLLHLPGVNPSLVPNIDPNEFTKATQKLRSFFLSKGFFEVHTQNRLSIMAACEDPNTIATYNYQGDIWPLPQTGQMWLEYELLANPEAAGFFCLSTSYRNEPNPVDGRHNVIFPMFEFESKGDLIDLEMLERELLAYLGFGEEASYNGGDYKDIAAQFGTETIENEQEKLINEELGNPFFLRHFPEYTSPFWNMKRSESGTISNKIDIIIHGMETIGSAERSCDPEQMRNSFLTIENGAYAQKLFDLFGEKRVMNEFNHFLSLDFIPRFGGGIGLGRLIKGLQLSNLL